MKKLVFVIVLLLIASAVIAQEGLSTTISQNANMRSGPDSTFESLGIVRAGTAINIDGRSQTGDYIRGITSQGTIGWVSSGTVDITLNQLNGLPIITVDSPFTLAAPASAAPPAANQPPDASSGSAAGTSVTAAANLNIRSGPHTDYRRLGALANGETFALDGRDSTSGWVRGISAAGVIGWVSAQYINIDPGTLNTLPEVNNDTPFTVAAPGGGAPVAAAAEEVPAAAPVVSTAPIRGFSYGGHVAGFSGNTFDWMRRAGMSWIKKQWRYVPGQNPGEVAGWINEAHAAGFRMLVGITVADKNLLANPEFYNQYAGFVAGVAAIGADAIEVLNEPNIDHEWPSGSISPARYTDLLRVSYNAIKAANPNTLVISAAPAPTGFFGGCHPHGCDDNLFIAGMAAAGAANYMDCLGIHYNEGIIPPSQTSGDPRNPSNHYTRYFRSMMDVYNGAIRGARPLCFTEMGYLTPEGYGPLSSSFGWAGNTSVAQQAAWLDQAVNIARSSGRVRLMIIWNVDFTNYGEDPMAGYAMIRPGNICPACEALGS